MVSDLERGQRSEESSELCTCAPRAAAGCGLVPGTPAVNYFTFSLHFSFKRQSIVTHGF
jgi:hypothetical protein